MSYVYMKMPSPLGELTLVAHETALCAVLWQDHNCNLDTYLEQPNQAILSEAKQQLDEYFQGQRSYFQLPLDFQGTEFQKQVWQALLSIPYAETRSYKQIAIQIGRPQAVRAVGSANGKNPIPIIVPCHRVIGANGRLVGFSGGLDKKQLLLDIES